MLDSLRIFRGERHEAVKTALLAAALFYGGSMLAARAAPAPVGVEEQQEEPEPTLDSVATAAMGDRSAIGGSENLRQAMRQAQLTSRQSASSAAGAHLAAVGAPKGRPQGLVFEPALTVKIEQAHGDDFSREEAGRYMPTDSTRALLHKNNAFLRDTMLASQE